MIVVVIRENCRVIMRAQQATLLVRVGGPAARRGQLRANNSHREGAQRPLVAQIGAISESRELVVVVVAVAVASVARSHNPPRHSQQVPLVSGGRNRARAHFHCARQ